MPGRLLVSVSSIFDETLDGVRNLVDELEKLIRRKAAEKVEADAAVIARG